MPSLTKEQQRVIEHEKGNILVSASAGSGKTFVMIERLIRLILEKKTSVKNILCVTFTESAAAEMKEKLKKAIIKKINEGEDLTEELLDVETADVCTIDSFCARLVRKYFFEAGVSPDFKICDEKQASVLKSESIDKTFREFYESGDKDFLMLLTRHGKYRSDRDLKALVLKIYEFLQNSAEPEEFIKECIGFYQRDFSTIKESYKQAIIKRISPLYEHAEELYQASKRLEFDSAIVILDQVLRVFSDIVNKDIYAIKEHADLKISLSFGRNLSQEQKEVREEIKGLCAKILPIIQDVIKHLTTPTEDEQKAKDIIYHLECIFKVVREFTKNYSEEKLEENLLDFSDLEHYALKILSNPQTKEMISENYDYIFADEYQDVNGVQEELFSRLSRDNLFVVGDVKQSIYGFRGSMPEIFLQKEKHYEATNQATVRLNHNFRSSKAVLDMVNEIFSFSMTESIYGTDYLSTAMLVPGGVYIEEAPGRVQLHLLEKEERKKKEKPDSKVYNLLDDLKGLADKSVGNIAFLIDKIVREELGKTYYDAKEEKFREISYSDIVILNKNSDNEYVYTLVKDLLKLGVPIASKVSENICTYPEIEILINLLKLIDCKDQDFPLVSVMKSPIGNFTEEELMDIALLYRQAENFDRKQSRFFLAYLYALENAPSPLKEKLVALDKYIEELRFLADFTGASGILEKAIDDCNFESYIIIKGRVEEKLARLNLFLSIGAKDRIYTVSEFLDLIQNSPDTFTMTPPANEDSVRLMTIHASKGLEFPVVIVCGLEKASNKISQYEEVLKDLQLGLAPKTYHDQDKEVEENIYRGVFKEKLRIERIKEDLRLLYVALTRASYSMHVTLEAKGDIRKDVFRGAYKFSDYIPKSLDAVEVEREELDRQVDLREPRKVLISKGDEEKSKEIKESIEFAYPFKASTILPIKCSVTGALDESEKVYEFNKEFIGQSSIELGTLAHKILENINFDGVLDGNFNSQVEDMIENKILSREEVGRLDLLRLESAVNGFAPYLKGKTLYREQPFIAKVDADKIYKNQEEQVLVQGVIDLLAVEQDCASIIDYKYSTMTSSSLKEKYSLQLELYALAVEKVLKLKVKKKILVNILTGECIEL